MDLTQALLPSKMKLNKRTGVVRCDEGRWGYLALQNCVAFLATKIDVECIAFVSPGLYAHIRKVLDKNLNQDEEVAIGLAKIRKAPSLTHFSFSIRS